MIEIAKLTLDVTTQARAAINNEVIEAYAEHLQSGGTFPAVKVFYDRKNYWLADGWHRVMAHQKIGSKSIAEDIAPGSRQDAIRYALGANRDHGLRRTNADKRRAVEIALREFPDLSSRAIAEMCAVSHPTVESARGQVEKFTTSTNAQPEKRTGKDGKAQAATKAAKLEAADKRNPVIVPERERPEEEYTERDRELDELRGAVEALNTQNDELRVAVAAQTAPEGLDGMTVFPEMQARIRALEAENAALKTRRDGLMNELAAAKRQIQTLRAKLDKALAA